MVASRCPPPAVVWGGAVAAFDPNSAASSSSFVGVGVGIGKGRARREGRGTKNNAGGSRGGNGSKWSGTALAGDPLARFQDATSSVGLPPAHSHFRADPPHRAASSHNPSGGSGRHVQWDKEDDEEEEANDDDNDNDCYHYGHSRDGERKQEEARRRKLEQREHQAINAWRNWC